MQQRNVSDAELNEALTNIVKTSSTPEDSTCIVGKTKAGRILKIWIVGTTFASHRSLGLEKYRWEGRVR